MSKHKFGFVFITIMSLSFFSYRLAYSLFTSAAVSANNTFTAAAIFPSPSTNPSPSSSPSILPSSSPSSSPSPSPSPSVSPTNIANHIIISEVQIDGGPSNADKDFIELYNPTNNSIDVNNYRLVKRTGNGSTDTTIKSFTSSTIIPAHHYYLWANSSIAGYATSIGADTSTGVDLTNSNSIALRNGAENTGTIVDALSWNNGATIGEGTNTSAPSSSQSLERKAYSTSTITSMAIGGIDEFKGNGFDSDNNVNDFIIRSLSQPQNSGSSVEIP